IKKYFTKEVKIGILAVASLALLLFGLNFLKGINIFNPSNFYYATYDNIGGLVETSPVLIKGHQVGQVREIKYDFTKEPSFVITLDISSDLELPEGTRAELFDKGLMGGKAIRIVYAPQTGQYEAVGDTIKSVIIPNFVNAISDELIPKINTLLSSTDSLILSVRDITNSPKLKNSLASIEQSSANLEETTAKLKGVMNQDVPKIVKNVNTITTDFAQVGNNLKEVDLAKTVDGIDATILELKEVSRKMNSNEGSLGLLINDRALYDNLSNTSNNANLLVVDIKQNPKRYLNISVFGSKKEK
ncbi:MAG: MCE family protein, partial [Paludibacteraceae bacterium]|nr:MCE family protein [Paludibacteraceae bacterium]